MLTYMKPPLREKKRNRKGERESKWGKQMGGKRTRFRTTTKQHIPFRAKPQKTRTSHLHLAATTTTTTTSTSTSTSTLYGGPCLNRGLSLMRLWANTGRFFKWEKCWDFFFLYLNLRLLSGAQGFNVWFNTLCW